MYCKAEATHYEDTDWFSLRALTTVKAIYRRFKQSHKDKKKIPGLGNDFERSETSLTKTNKQTILFIKESSSVKNTDAKVYHCTLLLLLRFYDMY